MKIEIYESKKQPKKASSFTLNWVHTLGWEENPFTKDMPLAGMEDQRKEINFFFIKEKNFGVIQGKDGFGKSALLNWLQTELQQYKEIRATLIHADRISSEDDLRVQIAAPYRSVFTKKNPLSTQELIEKIEKKEKRKHVLLIDDVDELNDGAIAVLKALHKRGTTILVTARKSIDIAKDQLGLKLKSPSKAHYEKILRSRIEAVGGQGIHPFSDEQVTKLAKAADSINEFLDLAAEIAIELALKGVVAEKPKQKKKKSTKREYDDLIESLSNEL